MTPEQTEVNELQRELLTILRPNGERPTLSSLLRGPAVPEGEILRIRRRIRQLNPDAALYEFWGGPMPDPDLPPDSRR